MISYPAAELKACRPQPQPGYSGIALFEVNGAVTFHIGGKSVSFNCCLSLPALLVSLMEWEADPLEVVILYSE